MAALNTDYGDLPPEPNKMAQQTPPVARGASASNAIPAIAQAAVQRAGDFFGGNAQRTGASIAKQGQDLANIGSRAVSAAAGINSAASNAIYNAGKSIVNNSTPALISSLAAPVGGPKKAPVDATLNQGSPAPTDAPSLPTPKPVAADKSPTALSAPLTELPKSPQNPASIPSGNVSTPTYAPSKAWDASTVNNPDWIKTHTAGDKAVGVSAESLGMHPRMGRRLPNGAPYGDEITNAMEMERRRTGNDETSAALASGKTPYQTSDGQAFVDQRQAQLENERNQYLYQGIVPERFRNMQTATPEHVPGVAEALPPQKAPTARTHADILNNPQSRDEALHALWIAGQRGAQFSPQQVHTYLTMVNERFPQASLPTKDAVIADAVLHGKHFSPDQLALLGAHPTQGAATTTNYENGLPVGQEVIPTNLYGNAAQPDSDGQTQQAPLPQRQGGKKFRTPYDVTRELQNKQITEEQANKEMAGYGPEWQAEINYLRNQKP